MRLPGLLILLSVTPAFCQDAKTLCTPGPDWHASLEPAPQSAANLLEQMVAAEPSSAKYPAMVASLEHDAARGNADAQYNTGVAYLRGIGVRKDSAKAVKWLKAAAEQGHTRAAAQLAAVYLIGNDVPRDDVAALMWTYIARALGAASYNDETQETWLSKDQVAEAQRKSMEWYRAHARNPAIAYALAVQYFWGRGVEKDEKEAFRWFLAAAKAGVVDAQLQVGAKYLNGHGVETNESEARVWFRRAADRGKPMAQAMLAEVCRKLDIDAGFAWLRLAADAQDAFAMNKLAKWDLSAEFPKLQNLPEGLHFAMEAVKETRAHDADYLHTLADAYQANGKTREALDAARKAVDLQPDDFDLLNSLAWMDVTVDTGLRNPAEGLSLAKRAVALTKENNPWLLDTLAEAQFVNGAIDEAIVTERKALALKPPNPATLEQNLEKYLHARDKL